MLSKVADWSLLTSPAVNDEYIQKIISSVNEVVAVATDGDHEEYIAMLVSFVLSNVEREDKKNKAFFDWILSVIRKYQPSLPSSLPISSPEIKLISSLALGEIISRDWHDVESDYSHLSAVLFASGVGLADISHEHYRKLIVDELRETCDSIIEKKSSSTRTSRDAPELNLNKFNANGALPDIVSAIREEFGSVFKYIENIDTKLQQSQEELEILWWLYNSFSETHKKYLKDLPIFLSAICCGAEIGNKVSVSAPLKVRVLVSQSVLRNRKASSLAMKSLKDIVPIFDKCTMDMLTPLNQNIKNFALDHPSLFPVLWINQRLVESQGTAEIAREFTVRSGIDIETKVAPDKFAVQVYNEVMALKVWENYAY